MKKNLMQKIVRLHNPDLSLLENARRISCELDANYSTVTTYLSAYREGFASREELLVSRDKDFKIKRAKKVAKVFGTPSLKTELYVNSRGFENIHESKTYLAREIYDFENYHQVQAFIDGRPIPKARDRLLEFIDPILLDRRVAKENDYVAIGDEELQKLPPMLEKLSEIERKIIDLHYFQDKSFREIEALLGKPESTVRGMLKRSIDKMRLFLREHSDTHCFN